MGLLIDTSVLVAWERRSLDVEARLAALGEELLAISSVTAMELLHGLHRSDASHRPGREAFVEHLLSRWPVLPIDLDVARTAARIWAELAAVGAFVGANDLLIAATAAHHGYGVATRNPKHFAPVVGLRVEAW